MPPSLPPRMPERVGRRRHLADLGLEQRQAVGPRHRVIHQRAGQKLAGVAVVDAFLPQRLADALRDAAVALAVDQHRVDRPAAIVDRRVAGRSRRRRSPGRSPPRRPRRCRRRTECSSPDRRSRSAARAARAEGHRRAPRRRPRTDRRERSVPFTRKRCRANSISASATSSIAAAILAAFLDDLVGGLGHRPTTRAASIAPKPSRRPPARGRCRR